MICSIKQKNALSPEDESVRGTTSIRQPLLNRRTHHPDHHRDFAVTGSPVPVYSRLDLFLRHPSRRPSAVRCLGGLPACCPSSLLECASAYSSWIRIVYFLVAMIIQIFIGVVNFYLISLSLSWLRYVGVVRCEKPSWRGKIKGRLISTAILLLGSGATIINLEVLN
jgi:hypothetical protein